ncbi:hypothetical protein BASA81_000547 [Batrachochytrium salamandrivorans]|nr:hypothetical protein BASA81_000547 [Batrachochytrium salamandrivorans]
MQRLAIELEHGRLGPGAVFGFVEWVLLSRTQASTSLLASPSGSAFAADFSLLLSFESVLGVAVGFGPTYASLRELFWLDLPFGTIPRPSEGEFDFGKQKLAQVCVSHLSRLEETRTRGIHLLVKVLRSGKGGEGFSVVDEDLNAVERHTKLGLHMRVGDGTTATATSEGEDCCWVVWTREVFNF